MENHEVPEVELKKRYLKRYRKNRACILRLEKKLKTLDERITSVRTPNYSGMPRGGIPVTLEDMIADKTDLEDRIKRLKIKARALRREILEAIDTVEDSRYCEILEAFFIDCLSIADIAESIGYTERYTYELYKEAVDCITVNAQ